MEQGIFPAGIENSMVKPMDRVFTRRESQVSNVTEANKIDISSHYRSVDDVKEALLYNKKQ